MIELKEFIKQWIFQMEMIDRWASNQDVIVTTLNRILMEIEKIETERE